MHLGYIELDNSDALLISVSDLKSVNTVINTHGLPMKQDLLNVAM